MSIALCLLALSAGYFVYLSASREKEGLKLLGQVIGIIVMLISVFTAACCMTQSLSYKWGDAKNCPISSMK